MKKIAFAGSFDPITQGHLWVIQEALTLADEVTIFVAENVSKNTWFNAHERCEIIKASCQDLKLEAHQKIHIEIVRGEYVAKAALARGIPYLIRGIRSTNDYDYENLLQQTNAEVLQGAKTVFVMPPRDLGSVSSSFIKGFIGPVGWHWQIKRFLPFSAYMALLEKWLKKQWMSLVDQHDHVWEAYFTELITHYKEAHRHYHHLDHLVHCISELQRLTLNTKDYQLLLASIFFHDVIYDVNHTKHDQHSPVHLSNEEKSAALAQSMLQGIFNDEDQDQIQRLILATAHLSLPNHQHEQHLVDTMRSIDLSILGQDEVIYQRYTKQIRAEYQIIPEAIYNAARSKVLSHFLKQAQQNQLYTHQEFAKRYNHRAIQNLQQELHQLQLMTTNEDQG